MTLFKQVLIYIPKEYYCQLLSGQLCLEISLVPKIRGLKLNCPMFSISSEWHYFPSKSPTVCNLDILLSFSLISHNPLIKSTYSMFLKSLILSDTFSAPFVSLFCFVLFLQ